MMSPRAAVLVLLGALVAAPCRAEDLEARVSLDVKDVPVESIVSVLLELGERQVVFDPGLSCNLTLKLHELSWSAALDTTLRACGLGYEETAELVVLAAKRPKQAAAVNYNMRFYPLCLEARERIRGGK